ncbi:ABC transporter substrate-binding protein [Deinococcus sp. KSM4-11]|uniref:ABC transporter substrate-binding protein n=1 Tax=Deinococcus sp. KSM4-11 TaxID=2568654 RepID=UPI0010A44350|nr:ABC transporter substrate-binding protein [Deinococcus sp. KSM4-11]THF87014.1 ABC transporter substrate-binding protein [Deinococcus sp. KSM4-11]
MKLTAAFLSTTLVLGLAHAQQRGGEMTVSYKDDVTTLDPAIGYDWQNWPMEKMVFDGLLDYTPGTTTLVPRLAAKLPDVSADGRSYTFTLRSGVKFHNGRGLTASDVKYTLERVIDPKTKSPGQSFFLGIAGAQAFADGKAKEVTGIKVLSPTRVRITLSAPNAAFLNIMAMNFAFIVPREAVAAAKGDFGHKPVGTGPFTMTAWVSGQSLTFKRNPAYFLPALPYLDGVTVKVGTDPSVAYLGLQRGEVDLLGDGIPPAQFLQAKNDPQLKDNIISKTQVNTSYLSINTQMNELKDVRVRQAINHAVDKTKIIRIINGRGEVARGVLPPLMPGYDKTAKGYDYSPDKAKALLKAAGLASGFSTTLYTNSTDPNPRIAQSIQQDLAQVGIKVEIKSQAQGTVIEAAGSRNTAPLVWSGGMAWTQDFPDPSDFYGPILSCGSAVPGGWNWSWYCDKALDAQAAKADAMTRPAQRAARLKMYSAIFKTLNDQAVWVPIFHEVRYMMHSDRLQGTEAEFVDPIHLIGYERLWVKK